MRPLASLGLAVAVLLGVPAAQAMQADALTDGEQVRLARGEAVVRREVIERGGRRYVGGVTYEVLDAGADDLAAVLDDVRTWRRILPHTRDARRVGEREGDTLVEVTHGSSLVRVAYTLEARRDAGGGLRFWLDRGRPHDIDDAWGFLKADPLPDGRTLITWGILVDMGPGLLRDLFEERVQALALAVPDRVRDVVVERAARGRGAAR